MLPRACGTLTVGVPEVFNLELAPLRAIESASAIPVRGIEPASIFEI
jgi:hypothetical protein